MSLRQEEMEARQAQSRQLPWAGTGWSGLGSHRLQKMTRFCMWEVGVKDSKGCDQSNWKNCWQD